VLPSLLKVRWYPDCLLEYHFWYRRTLKPGVPLYTTFVVYLMTIGGQYLKQRTIIYGGKRNLYDHPKLEHLQPLPSNCFTKIRRFWETVKYLKNFFLNFLTLILTPPTLNGTGLKSVFQRTIRITRLDFKDNKNFLVRQIFWKKSYRFFVPIRTSSQTYSYICGYIFVIGLITPDL